MSAALRARSPNIMDDIVKRPPPSPSDKAPPQKKLDVKPRPASEEPTPKAGSPVIAPKEKSDLKETEKKDEPSRQDVLDTEVFGQILELDDGDRSFVSAMVNEYFEQVDVTFDQMDQAMQTKDLKQISQLGHFLKGSSAALGVKRVSATCEKIQNTAKGIPTEKTLEEVMSLLKRVKEEYNAAKRWLLLESSQTCP
ncbi:histidine-phosphotransfer domain, HPT domain-containing protein [Rhizopogon salebrosus TDB-379]|nr:histidine-phosphotransfer domain, HPT domain-containing protein [Rhizopogon salebrosus TDB-379]